MSDDERTYLLTLRLRFTALDNPDARILANQALGSLGEIHSEYEVKLQRVFENEKPRAVVFNDAGLSRNEFMRRNWPNHKYFPGETPLQYRTRIGHSPVDPRTWDLDEPESHTDGTYAHNTCGCTIVGNGTLPYPFSILFCQKHGEAP